MVKHYKAVAKRLANMKRITNQRQIPSLAGYDEENNRETFCVFPVMIKEDKCIYSVLCIFVNQFLVLDRYRL